MVDRILSAESRAVVVLGPAGSGKTAAAMGLWRHLRQGHNRGCILVAPNAAGVAYWRGMALAAAGSGVVVGPDVMTFAALAGRILMSAGRRAPVQSPFRRRLLLRRIVNELHSAGQLTALAGVAETPGLVVALDRSIGELKRAAVEPETLGQAIGSATHGKARDLLVIYRRYQQHLQDAGLYDVEGRMWLVRDLLSGAAGDRPCDPEIGALVADAFTDFTPTQLAVLRLLAGRGTRIVLTLPWADDGRTRMWHWTRRTLNNIRHAFGAELTEITLGEGASRYAPLCRAVFDFDADRQDAPANLGVIAAAGIEAEVAAVARRVKRLLVDGAPAGSIAVLVRSPDAYRSEIERIFAECDIPVTRTARALDEVPVVRFALDAASLGPEFAFGDVLRTIKSSYFRPAALGEFDGSTVAMAEMLIREGNVLSGRDAYAAAADRLARRITAMPQSGDEDEEPGTPTLSLGPLAVSREALARAAAMLEALFDLAAPAAAGGSCHAEALRGIIDGLELSAVACEAGEVELVARDLRAISALEAALAELAATEADGALTPDEVAGALSAATCPPERGAGIVDVMSVLDARAVRREHVFLLGLGQGQFPGRFVEDSLIGESDRSAWANKGVTLDSRADLNAREMLLFYLAVSRAEASLTLSYRSADASGRPEAPGSFLVSLLRSTGGADAVDVESVSPGMLVPRPEEIASSRDALNAGIAGLFRGDLGDCRDALSWAAAAAPGPVARAAAALWAHERRWRRGPCDAFDGRITEPALLNVLADRFADRAVFSARRLDTFGQCPWRFFATYVLKLNELPEPQRMLEPTGRGLFCHDVLCRTYHLLGERFGRPVRPADIAAADVLAALGDAVAAASDQIEAQRPPYPLLWQIQREQMHRQLERYMLAQQGEPDMPAESLHFELSFGMGTAAAGSADVADPVDIAIAPGRTIGVKGRIDRVDRVTFEASEGLLVVDYKTGSLPGVHDIRSGRSVQAVLYSAAVERMFGPEVFGGAFHRVAGDLAEQYFARVKRYRGGIVADGAYESNRDQAMAQIGRFVDAMRAGQFDLAPTGRCPSYCPFRRICRYSEPRAEVKRPDDDRGAAHE